MQVKWEEKLVEAKEKLKKRNRNYACQTVMMLFMICCHEVSTITREIGTMHARQQT